MRNQYAKWGSYEAFLASPEWEWCRTLVFARDGGECRACGGQDRLEGHHVHYRSVLDPDTVVTLCHWCHARHHEVERFKAAKALRKKEVAPYYVRARCPRCSGRYYCAEHGGD